MFGLLWDYFVTPKGFEIRLLRFVLIYRLKRENIIGVHPIDGMLNFGAYRRLGGHPWNTISMCNRWQRRWIMLEKRWWPRFLAVSPKNPDKFTRDLASSG
jgi:hypothetical protein